MTTSLDRDLLRHVSGPAPIGGEPALRYDGPRSRGGNLGVGTRIADLVRRLWHAFRVAQEARATARALAVLDDHSLRDIRVNRGSIPAVARQAASAHLAVAGLSWTSPGTNRAQNDNQAHRAA